MKLRVTVGNPQKGARRIPHALEGSGERSQHRAETAKISMLVMPLTGGVSGRKAKL